MLDFLLSWPVALAIASALVAIAWYVPPLRKPAGLALAGLAAAFAIRKGGERAGAENKQKEWDNAEDRMRDRARDINDRARERVDASPGGVRGSPYNRNKSGNGV